MTDIVERLLDATDRDRIDDAISEITTLRATNERLRGALERHVCDCKSNCAWERDETCPSWDALAALAQEKHND